MQQSNAQAAARAEVPAQSLWLLGPVRDLLLFVATPVLILPAVLGAQVFFTSLMLHKAVMAMGAMGHHLPGMMRAYGDKALFRRFRRRFLLSPLILVGLCVGFALAGLEGMVLIAYAWGVWHGMMQTYGFLRIYDAKVKSFATLTTRLDLALCATWFLGGVVHSDSRVYYIQDMATSCGWPVLGPAVVGAVRAVFTALLVGVTAAFLIHYARCRAAGARQSPIKLLLAGTSFAWWWYANVTIADPLIGLILFELFHDVQYLAIVWLFNRKRVDSDPAVGSFTRFLFRRSYVLLLVYIGLVALYGGLGPLAEHSFESGRLHAVARGLVTASALLHFYFDGFIWKMREESTRKNLGLAGGREDIRLRRTLGLTPAGVHAAKWLILLVPAGLLGVSQAQGQVNPVERARALLEASETLPSAHAQLGLALVESGDQGGAAQAFGRALELDPENDTYRAQLALTSLSHGEELVAAGNEAQAAAPLQRANAIDPLLYRRLNNEGLELFRARDLEQAALRYRTAILMSPDSAEPYLNLSLVLRDQGHLDEALARARRGLELRPTDARVRQLIAQLQAALEAQ